MDEFELRRIKRKRMWTLIENLVLLPLKIVLALTLIYGAIAVNIVVILLFASVALPFFLVVLFTTPKSLFWITSEILGDLTRSMNNDFFWKPLPKIPKEDQKVSAHQVEVSGGRA